MVRFTYPALNADQGTQTGNGIRNAANAAADAVCNLYQNAPTGIVPSFGDPFGVGGFTQGLLDDLCRDRNKLPPDPVPPFVGGQCDALYNLSGTWSQGEINGTFDGGNGYGKISNIRTVKNPDGRTGRLIIDQAVGTPSQALNQVLADKGFLDIQAPVVYQLNPIRLDGNPDNCGNPPPVYPTREPVPSDYTPIPPPVKTPTGTINIPITIIPTLVKPELNFKPEFNVEVGDLNINFNIDGVDVSFKPTFNFPPTGKPGNQVPFPVIDTRTNPPPSTPTRTPTVNCPTVDLTGIIQRLQRIEDCACDGNFTIASTVYGNAKGNVIDLPERALYVSLALQLGSGLRYQASEGIAPDLYYAGWLSFGRGGTFGERLRVDFAGSGYLVPTGATQFAYSLVFNTSAVPTVFRRVPIIPT